MEAEDDKPSNPLASFFGVEETSEEMEAQEIATVSELQTELDQDFELARGNLIDVVQLASTSMSAMNRLATQLGTPGGYMALSKLMASVVMANKALLEVHKHKQDVNDPGILATNEYHTHQTVIMTTAEMQARIEDAREKAKDNQDEAE